MRGCDRVRVSASGFCRIEIGGRYLLEVNKNRGNVLTPIGGAYEFQEAARPFLLGLGAEFEKRNDIRMMLPVDRLGEFAAWFWRREQRETSPMRELREELVEEHRGMDRWSDEGIRCRFLGACMIEEATTRRGLEGVLTRYFYEVFEIGFAPEQERQLEAKAGESSSRLRLATRQQIEARAGIDGCVIASHVAKVFFQVEGRTDDSCGRAGAGGAE